MNTGTDEEARRGRHGGTLAAAAVAVAVVAALILTLFLRNGRIRKNTDSRDEVGDDEEIAEVIDVWNGGASTQPPEGFGTEDDPYIIDGAGRLALAAKLVNSGAPGYAEAHYRLDSDLYLNDPHGYARRAEKAPANVWEPIGTREHPFSGVFDGGGHSVYGLYCESEDGLCGLFGSVRNGVLKDIRLCRSYLRGGELSGAAAAEIVYDSAEPLFIEKIGAFGAVESDGVSGGLFGRVSASGDGALIITGCCSGGELESGGGSCGGLAGVLEAENGMLSLNNSLSCAEIVAAGGVSGALAGTVSGDGVTVLKCVSSGSNTAALAEDCGKLFGKREGKVSVSGCYSAKSAGGPEEEGVRALSEDEMLREKSYEGFDFTDFWGFDNAGNYPYPVPAGAEYYPLP